MLRRDTKNSVQRSHDRCSSSLPWEGSRRGKQGSASFIRSTSPEALRASGSSGALRASCHPQPLGTANQEEHGGCNAPPSMHLMFWGLQCMTRRVGSRTGGCEWGASGERRLIKAKTTRLHKLFWKNDDWCWQLHPPPKAGLAFLVNRCVTLSLLQHKKCVPGGGLGCHSEVVIDKL